MPLHTDPRKLGFTLGTLPPLPRPRRVLLADPLYFDVAYAINPHLLDARGELERVDRARARGQWSALRDTLAGLELELHMVPALAGHPDLVFCANQALPLPGTLFADGRPRAVPSRMAHAQRRGEVAHVMHTLAALGFAPFPLTGPAQRLEGMGDGLWHPGRRLLWAGCGPRSEPAAWEELAQRLDLHIAQLELVDPDFYHLDTCLALLSEDACLWFPEALAPRARALVEALIPRRIEAPQEEARERLACNAYCPDGNTVLLPAGARRTSARLKQAGFRVRELDTGEFGKSGGSVFCMKLALPD